MSYNAITAGKDLPNDVYVVIEIPANHAPIKYEIDKADVELPFTPVEGPYDRMLGKEEPMSCEAEQNRQIVRPIQMYPIFENAIRHARGESVTDHINRVSELWAGFSRAYRDDVLNFWQGRNIRCGHTLRAA